MTKKKDLREYFEDDSMYELFSETVGMMRDGGASFTRDRTQNIRNLNPHYTDSRFQQARTVYLDEKYKLNEEGYPIVKKGVKIGYDYSDRFWQWDWNKANTTRQAANESHDNKDSAACIEDYLRLYFDKPNLKLIHIMAGYNVATGYPYQVFGYIAEPSSE